MANAIHLDVCEQDSVTNTVAEIKNTGGGFETAAFGGRQLELVDLVGGNAHEGWDAWGLVAGDTWVGEVFSETESLAAELLNGGFGNGQVS